MSILSETPTVEHRAPCATIAVPPQDVKCRVCGVQHADTYVPEMDRNFEPTGRWQCEPCFDALLSLDATCKHCGADDHYGETCSCEFDREVAAHHAEAEYWKRMDAAESYGNYVASVAEMEAAEHEAETATITIICNVGRFRIDNQPVEAIAIKASRSIGYGSATVSYWAQNESGEWFPFLKKDNPKLKLPTSKDLTWLPRKLSDVRGVRACYRQETEPVAVGEMKEVCDGER